MPNRPFFSTFIFILISYVSVFHSGASRSEPRRSSNTGASATKGLQLLRQHKYSEAVSVFSKAARKSPRKPSLQYYLGLSSLYTKQSKQSKSALVKTVVMTRNNNPYHKKAAKMLQKYFRIEPYSCILHNLKKPKLVRWNRKTMPLKIFISSGRMLPDSYYNHVLSLPEILKIGKWTHSPSFMTRLAVSKHYNREFNRYVKKGIAEWNWAVSERLFAYTYTNKPTEADILVFWADKLSTGFDGYTYYPCYPAGKHDPTIVIVSLNSVKGTARSIGEHISRVVTHEFGHVLGLEHSPKKEDIMFHTSSRLPKKISVHDKATLRALYTVPADILLLSVSK